MQGRAAPCPSSAAVTVFYRIRNFKTVRKESARESGEANHLQTPWLQYTR